MMLLLMACIAAMVLADPPPVAEQVVAEAPETKDDVVATASFTMSSGGESSERVCTMRRGQDAAAAAVNFAEQHQVNVDGLIQIAQHMVGQAADYEPPKELRLRTAGAHKKKAEALAKEGVHDEAAEHVIRALLRPGLEESVVSQLKVQLERAMQKLVQQRQAEQKEAAEQAAAEARASDEAVALQEARARAERDEAYWGAFLAEVRAGTGGEVEGAGGADGDAEPLVAMPLTLTRGEGAEKVPEEVHLRVLKGQDPSQQVYSFCAANNLHSAEQVSKLHGMVTSQLEQSGKLQHIAPDTDSAAAHLSRAAKQRREGAYAEAGAAFARALNHASADELSEAQLQDARSGVVDMMRAERRMAPFLEAVQAGRWEEAVTHLEKVPRDERSASRLQLLEARAYQKLGRWGNAQRAAARVVEATATYSNWERGQPRMLAVALGSAAALELGDGKKALDFFSSVLKYDPDQTSTRQQYKKLKEVLKLTAEAETQLTKGYNHRAVTALDDVLGKLRGMDVGSALFRAQILLKLCRARSSMRKHEEAMHDCMTAYRAITEPGLGVPVSAARLREALEARAEAHANDQNYDDAVSDLRAALEKAGDGEKAAELQQRLAQAQDQQRRWRCVDSTDRKAWQDNRCGHPHQPNSGRDHRQVLELPANLDQLKREDQCTWVTRQYRKLARTWHPDRYKGLKVRAERKMRECSEAKEVLVRQLKC